MSATNLLADRAMLVNVNISAWSGRKHDRKVSDEVARQHGANRDVGRYNKVLLAAEALKDVSRVARLARDAHYTDTLPWSDIGQRILPAANFFAYTQTQNAFHAEFDHAVDQFVAAYPSYVEDAKVRLNGLFNAADYPSERQIARKFGFDVDFMPMPDVADFRVSLSDEAHATIASNLEARLKDATDLAVRDLWQRVHDTVTHMHERLSAYAIDATGKVTGGIFRDSMVTNLRDLVELLPRLNVTADAQLEAMRQKLVEKLCPIEPDDLRTDATLRQETAQTAADILAAMAGYTGQ